jgi:hypothetical protein
MTHYRIVACPHPQDKLISRRRKVGVLEKRDGLPNPSPHFLVLGVESRETIEPSLVWVGVETMVDQVHVPHETPAVHDSLG